VADLRQAVIKKVLFSLTKREARAARGTTTAATRTEEWLKMCGDKAVEEVGALARRKDSPQFEVKVLRTRAGDVRDRMCQDLDAGARIIGVAPGRDQELSELEGNLCSFKELQLPADSAASCDKHQALVMRSIGHNLCAIQGPPGTGKTTLIANMLEHALPNLTTLVTCVQNKALEPIAQKLASNSVNFAVLAGRELGAAPGGGGIGFRGGASGAGNAPPAACSAAPAGGAHVGFCAAFNAFDTPVGREKQRAIDKLGAVCSANTLAALASREMTPAFSQAVRRLAKVIVLGRAEKDELGRAEEEEEEGSPGGG
jgi:hypothetical protein